MYTQVLKPVAVGGGSQDAALSPRPPPVDPSPPRTLADASTNIVDSSASTLVHQQAQTSPPVSRDQCGHRLDRLDVSQSIGTARPQSAREHGSALSHVAVRTTPQVIKKPNIKLCTIKFVLGFTAHFCYHF
ncbi:hypothetical protein ANCCAN_01320 [Ancylostoma caninum]|uniref:Uncharacterized protein n=1 Tax=Ancylostoma caninum TaxID=29170 RepID=A0A368H7N9_ANCCA|nr:hypothetical protein ANCCAN_01320 [Ancylostoma caninum]